MRGSFALRIAVEWLIWLPVWLLFSTNMTPMAKSGLAASVLLFSTAGLLLNRLPPLWRKITLIAVLLALAAVGALAYKAYLPMLIWLGLVLWRGRFARLGPRHYALAFGVSALALIAVAQNEAWIEYRLALIGIALSWMLVWFAALNGSLVEGAGLGNGIVTRPVRRAGRKYVYLFLSAGVLIVAATVDYGQRLLTPRQVSAPDFNWIKPERLIPPPAANASLDSLLPEQGKPSPVWDYLLWLVLAFAVLAFLWFARLLWKDRTWTWRGLMRALKGWFLRDKSEESLPYVEERRSLKKGTSGLLAAWLHRSEARAEWGRLNNSEKARRLYEDVVRTGVQQGFAFQASDTPAETLDGIERWRGERRDSAAGKLTEYWQRLLRSRRALQRLYEKARYSPHNIESVEVEEMRKQLLGDAVGRERLRR
jgi:hypothetical protein